MRDALGLTNLLIVGTVGLVVATLVLIFVWVPTDANQGAVQRIFYLHVPVAWVCMIAILFVALFSILYLVRGRERWDRLAQSMAEVGMVFGTLMLISGIIWARPVWGQWWTGEAKLTTALILYLVYIAYLLFRAFLPKGVTRNRLSAVIAIVGAALSPIIYYASQLWEQAHPRIIVGPAAAEGDGGLPVEFTLTLLISFVGFLFLFGLMTRLRYNSRSTEDETDEILREIDLKPTA